LTADLRSEGPVPGSYRIATAPAIEAAWSRMAAGLQPRVADGGWVLLGILLGAMPTLVNVARRLEGDFLLDVCRVSRYRGATTGGELQWLAIPGLAMAGRRVVIIDDIYDAGQTLATVAAWCRAAGAREVVTAVLARRRAGAGAGPDIAGMTIGDEYVYGCGMDYHGAWRHLPDLYALPPA
jgi:hypoxanthine phosphoribosyltransferase